MVATPFTLERGTGRWLAPILGLVVLGLGVGFSGSWSFAPVIGLSAALALSWWFCTRISSIEARHDGLLVRHPFQSQFVPFSSLGEFIRVDESPGRPWGFSFAQARLKNFSVYRSHGIVRTRTLFLCVGARFRIGGESGVLSVDELVELLNKCREQAAASA